MQLCAHTYTQTCARTCTLQCMLSHRNAVLHTHTHTHTRAHTHTHTHTPWRVWCELVVCNVCRRTDVCGVIQLAHVLLCCLPHTSAAPANRSLGNSSIS